ncbi:unnamed protein product [Musa acuminata subsp. burmannicoides]
MGLELVDVREFPPLPAVRTTGTGDKPVAQGPSESGSEGEVECSTPKSEELEPKPAMVCPPAPRKPRPAKRKLGPPPKGYYPVPSDLASVFVPLSRLPNKRIRIGMAEEECNTNLSLAIDGGRQFMPGHRSKPTLHLQVLFPHHPKEEEEEEPIRIPRSKNTEEEEVISGRDTSNCSNDKLFGTRKKLKLTKEQVTLLEDRFREHNTLNTAQKQDLADRLNIQTRQVEVWFQNRRARTKLKQIEVDYECLKKWCESLSDENRRLKKELQELRSANPGSPFYMHLLKAATLTICPSCERMAAIGGGAAGKSTSAFDGMKGQLVPVKNGLLGRRN